MTCLLGIAKATNLIFLSALAPSLEVPSAILELFLLVVDYVAPISQNNTVKINFSS